MDQNKHVIDFLPDFLTGAFDKSERDAIQSHLQSCPSCRQEYESLSTVWNSLGVLPDEKPGPQLRARFDAMLAAYEQGIRHASSRATFLDSLDSLVARLWPRRPALQFGIAVITLVFGGVIGTMLVRSPDSPATMQTNLEIAQLHGEVQTIRGMLAVSLMQQQSASDRLKGVSMSSRIAEQNPKVMQSLLDALRYDPSVNVRLAALDALAGSMDEPEVRATVAAALPKQSSPLVQLAMVELVVEAHDKGSIGVLNKMEKDPTINDAVRKKIQQGIKLLL
ncbi:MAG TPA: zf-HC2 domain-containing protein [Bacteroidota bacterium]|nr:zf-HC2 domain-containing protein [Bacteroidota bacterium]